jgi:hypothetical protein
MWNLLKHVAGRHGPEIKLIVRSFNHRFIWGWVVAFMQMSESYASGSEMKQFLINVPPHRIAFSIPQQVVNANSERKWTSNFAITDLEKSEAMSETLAKFDFIFSGPIWRDAYGIFTFDLSIIKRDPKIGDGFSTIPELASYIRRWCNSSSQTEPDKLLLVEQVNLNGLDCVRRSFHNSNNLNVVGSYSLEVYSIPLGRDCFLDIAFVINPLSGGRTRLSKWTPRAEEWKQTIRRTMSVESVAASSR